MVHSSLVLLLSYINGSEQMSRQKYLGSSSRDDSSEKSIESTLPSFDRDIIFQVVVTLSAGDLKSARYHSFSPVFFPVEISGNCQLEIVTFTEFARRVIRQDI